MPVRAAIKRRAHRAMKRVWYSAELEQAGCSVLLSRHTTSDSEIRDPGRHRARISWRRVLGPRARSSHRACLSRARDQGSGRGS
eukprot:3790463-Rhodomonas_salina.2